MGKMNKARIEQAVKYITGSTVDEIAFAIAEKNMKIEELNKALKLALFRLHRNVIDVKDILIVAGWDKSVLEDSSLTTKQERV